MWFLGLNGEKTEGLWVACVVDIGRNDQEVNQGNGKLQRVVKYVDS